MLLVKLFFVYYAVFVPTFTIYVYVKSIGGMYIFLKKIVLSIDRLIEFFKNRKDKKEQEKVDEMLKAQGYIRMDNFSEEPAFIDDVGRMWWKRVPNNAYTL